MRKIILGVVVLAVSSLITSCTQTGEQKEESKKPNIIFVYVDDLGYGDVGCYGGTGVTTPNIDKMAENGVRFTDAHCGSSTCTPSRYSLLTGQYAFRSGAAVLPGDAPLIIEPGFPTLPSMLQEAGYTTGVVGKWHLGIGDGALNWNDSIKPGPIEVGFDYCFLIPATGDRVPTVYVENHHVVGLDPNDPLEVSFAEMIGNEPTGLSNPEMLRVAADTQHSETIVNGVSRIGYMTGGKSAHWVDEDFPDVLNQKAKDFIKNNKDNSFFLYYSFHDIHVPRLPHPRFQGKSEMGARGDVIYQMDWCTGEIVKYLEELGIAENTLIVFSSDNGPVLNDGYGDQSPELVGEHDPAGGFSGGKYSALEAGTRVPTIAYWPGTVNPSTSDALLTQVDLYASIASLVGYELKDGDAPDSKNTLDAWLGNSEVGRTEMLEESYVNGFRSGNWKYIPASNINPYWIEVHKGIASGVSKEPQLFNLENDMAEQKDLASEMPEKVKAMEEMYKKEIE